MMTFSLVQWLSIMFVSDIRNFIDVNITYVYVAEFTIGEST